MSVKLYGLDSSLIHDAKPTDGFVIDVVRFSDYAELERKYQAVVAESAALKAENCIQDFIISAVKDLVRESDGVTGWHLNGDVATWDEVLPELSHSETPATTQTLNGMKAKGIDEWIASRNGRWNGTTTEAELFAASLRGE